MQMAGKLVQSEQYTQNGGEEMGGLFSVGVLLIIVGVLLYVYLLLIPLDMLRKVFRRMRSKMGTKVGGVVLIIAGIVLMLYK